MSDSTKLEKLEQELDELLWKNSTIDAYKPVEDVGDKIWLPCPTCESRPRVWRFNNGEYAKCHCCDPYGQAKARGESVMSAMSRGVNVFDGIQLIDAWNKYVETGESQTTLPEGQW